ncbi:extracellular solute-binding protein [Halobacillus sp. ACCC02827]|uniref:ABC transporter substrate-binding protein n=1 Tax=Bacillaceae TaxID=186817 RepID=UPI0002A4FD25|nr:MULTISPECIES: extracellular solute-binding protein [Bacillaceae]ELK48459.1 sugar ABC transporter substrate-binding protein [Halobacillus sp. BAB-2008]QHT47839.1 extracellular solute-binding protein [Bacillus sp. SB49]WJE15079.1 extracellular solute-binding protein [Halobacillus sp. ACCC02827]
MKKLAMLMMLFLVLILTACSGSSNSAGGSEKKVLEFWHIDPGEKEKVYEEAVERFEEKHPDVEVKVLRIPNDAYKQKLSVAMSGGNPPDVFNSWGGGWLKQFVDQGKVLDVTEDVDKSHFNELALQNSMYEDKVYGLPLGLSIDVVFYNKEIFDKYGLEEPKTYQEWLEINDTLNENDIIPIALANKTKWPGAYYLMNFASREAGTDLFDSAFHREGKGFDDEGYVQAGTYIQEMVKNDAFNEGFNGVPYDEGTGRQLLYSGQAAMMDMTISFLNNVRMEAPEFEEKLDFFVFPEVEGGKGSVTDLGASASPVWSVSESSEHPDLATELIQELTSEETAQAYADRTGSLTSINGVVPNDEFTKKFHEVVEGATHLQMPYDQTLPPELAELHKDTTQAVFGLEMTPEEAAEKMEAKAKEVLE